VCFREFTTDDNRAIANCLLKRPQRIANSVGSLKEDDRAGDSSKPIEPFDSGF